MSYRIDARTPPPGAPAPIDTDPSVVSTFLSDAAHVAGGFSRGIVVPHTVGDIAATVATATQILPIGAQSSLTGGATPRGEIVLSTRNLGWIDVLDHTRVRVGAGVSLADLQRQLAAHGLYYPPVPTFDGAFVGGTIATNAAGAATFKYGSTRDWIDAISIVLASGAVLDVVRGEVTASTDGRFEVVLPDASTVTVPLPRYRMPAVPKLSAGYYSAPGMDLIDLFIGSEGTLGVITDAVLRVIPRRRRAVALVSCESDAQALAVTGALRAEARLAWVNEGGLDVSAVEYMDASSLQAVSDQAFAKSGIERPPAGVVMLLVQIETGDHHAAALEALGELLESCAVRSDAVIARDDRDIQRLFELREAVPASINGAVALAKQREDAAIEKTAGDFIVPFDRLAESLSVYRSALDSRGLAHAIWGHASDGNLHVNVVPKTMADVLNGREALVEIARTVIAMGGSPLAEHGVGRSVMKQTLLRELYGAEGIEQMRAVKRALDPEWKLSPGVLFPAERHQQSGGGPPDQV